MIPILLHKTNQVALIDDEDYHKVCGFTWYLNQGYAKRYISVIEGGRGLLTMQRAILEMTNPSVIIHHKDRNKLNNQKENLEVIQTNAEHSKLHHPGKSKFLGLTWTKEGFWFVQVYKQGKLHYVGRYKDEVEAARAYDQKAIELFGLEANINFTESRGCLVPNTVVVPELFLRRPSVPLTQVDTGSTEAPRPSV